MVLLHNHGRSNCGCGCGCGCVVCSHDRLSVAVGMACLLLSSPSPLWQATRPEKEVTEKLIINKMDISMSDRISLISK